MACLAWLVTITVLFPAYYYCNPLCLLPAWCTGVVLRRLASPSSNPSVAGCCCSSLLHPPSSFHPSLPPLPLSVVPSHLFPLSVLSHSRIRPDPTNARQHHPSTTHYSLLTIVSFVAIIACIVDFPIPTVFPRPSTIFGPVSRSTHQCARRVTWT